MRGPTLSVMGVYLCSRHESLCVDTEAGGDEDTDVKVLFHQLMIKTQTIGEHYQHRQNCVNTDENSFVYKLAYTQLWCKKSTINQG